LHGFELPEVNEPIAQESSHLEKNKSSK